MALTNPNTPVSQQDLQDFYHKILPYIGSGGTSDYTDLENKPQIEGVTLTGNKTASDLGLAKVNQIPTVPTKVSQLQNDSGFLSSETDPTVPSWAKQQNPPTPATFDGEHAGLVPAPASGDSGKYLKADGSWATPSGGASWVEVTGTLATGETSITLSDAAITSTSTIDVYTDADVDYNSITPGTGSVTITFDAQQSNLGVKVRVS